MGKLNATVAIGPVQVPGRVGDPLQDIAPVAVLLASDDCRYITCNTFFVEGGAHIHGVHLEPQLPS